MPPNQLNADLILTGGLVLTLDERNSEATAIATRGGRIVYVGDDDGAIALVTDASRHIDLAGRAVIPGINESHMHATWLGAIWPATIMDGLAGGSGFAQSTTLESSAERRAAILRAGDIAASLGITSYTEPGLGPGEDDGATGACGSDVLEQYRALAAEGLLRARVTVLMLFGELDGPSTIDDFERGIHDLADDDPDSEWFRIGGIKVFADGIPPMRSAWIHGHYLDGTHGTLLVEGIDESDRAENMRAMITLAHELGYQVGVHATGDKSIDAVVEIVESLDGSDLRHYIIHGDLVGRSTLDRMAALGIGLNTQAGIAPATSAMLAATLGPQVALNAWPIPDALAAGIPLCLSSDAPVLTPDWRIGIAAAAAWAGEGSLGDPRQTMLTLLKTYTVNPAWQDRAESWKGTLTVGKVADLCVLARNPLEVTPAELPGVTVDVTVAGGRVVFERS
ncbi:MAG: amidohydrolase family protein [Salinibacterium sp.]|nr:amidohydrolase family protein [Salinibacterium sp.]